MKPILRTEVGPLRACARFAAFAVVLLAAQGCLYNRYNTNTGRSATEQLLISDSIRRAVSTLAIPDVEDRKVVVEISAVPSNDTAYFKSALEARLGSAGATLTSLDQADLRIVALVGAVGTVDRNASFGLPPLPIPSIGTTPAIPFIAAKRQRGYTEAQIVTWSSAGRLVARSDLVVEASRFDITSVLFFEIRRNDVFPGEQSFSIAID